MSANHSELDDDLRAFVEAQQVFFVGTAPLSGEGHVNVSPKGLDSLRVLDAHTLVWRDRVGSGVETIAHLRENGRITLMFCAFDGLPRIVRLQGRGTVLVPGDADFAELEALFPAAAGVRALIRVALDRVAGSCGYGVPIYTYKGQRDIIDGWAQRKGPAGVVAYQAQHNTRSIDGLPGHVPAGAAVHPNGDA